MAQITIDLEILDNNYFSIGPAESERIVPKYKIGQDIYFIYDSFGKYKIGSSTITGITYTNCLSYLLLSGIHKMENELFLSIEDAILKCESLTMKKKYFKGDNYG